jgi:GH35 family endo-1,4-beta-xylanase
MALALLLSAKPIPAISAQLSEEQLLATANQRIEEHRKADATVALLDVSGKPVAGAQVVVEQTRHAFLFGSNIFKWGRLPNEEMESAYREHFAELLNYATLPFYWTSYEPRRAEPMHDRTERVARWCRQQRILTKGHPLAWNMGDPPWLPDDLEEIRRLQMARIEDCVSRLAGLIDRWDVVNEPTHYDRPDFVNRRAPKHSAMWKHVGQVEFTRQCFQHARKAGPNAILLVNDYRTDPPYERVIEQLVECNGKRLYDVIGIQSHMHGGVWPTHKIWEVCQRFSRFGVPLHFTETTILSVDGGWQRGRQRRSETTPEGEAYQAREAVRFYTMLFSHPAVEAVTWWDFTDYQSWQRAPAGFLRRDMTPKPMYHELKKLIKGKWWTKTTLKTGADGTATFRGFLGDYRLTATADSKRVDAQNLVLGKHDKNRWQIVLQQ